VQITLKRAFSDGTVAIDMAPFSLLSRLAAAVPYPRFHTVRYSGALASASKVRPRIAPKQKPVTTEGEAGCVHHVLAYEMPAEVSKRGPYRPWAELLKRTFHVDVLECPKCQGRMRLLAVLTEDHEVRRYLRGISEAPKAIPGTGIVAGAASVCRSGAKSRATELPTKGPARAPPYRASRALRRRDLGDEAP
jgi:hypothetical protein